MQLNVLNPFELLNALNFLNLLNTPICLLYACILRELTNIYHLLSRCFFLKFLS